MLTPRSLQNQWHIFDSIHLQSTFAHLYPAQGFIIIKSFEWT